MDWQPIETAPKDGTVVLAGAKSSRSEWAHVFATRQRFERGAWAAYFGDKGPDDWRHIDPQPTHWKPLPKSTN